MATTLKTRNVTVANHRTSVRLEPAMWCALEEIAALERCSIHDICDRAAAGRQASTLTAAIRVHVMLYYRELAARAGLLPAREAPAVAARHRAGTSPAQVLPALSRVG